MRSGMEAGRFGARMRAGWGVPAMVLSGLLLATPALAQDAADDDAYADYDDAYFSDDDDTSAVHDPWEGMNRSIFSFNEGLDRWFLEPVAKGWDFVLPDFAQRSIRNAFDNASTSVDFLNNLLQGKPQYAGRDIARFLLNSTVGIGGLMDPASTIGLVDSNEDFGQTLAVWGTPSGPFLMLPFFGPSNIRDGAGLIVDTASTPLSYVLPSGSGVALGSVNLLNRRSLVIEQFEAERRAAVDFYAAMRSGYTQYRDGLIKARGGVDARSYGAYSGAVAPNEESP